MSHLSLPIKIIAIVFWALVSFSLPNYFVDDPLIQQGLSLLLLFAGLWMTEVFPLSVTALFVPVLRYC